MQVKVNETIINNLLIFLNRTNIKGAEVPAFVEIINAINTAKIEEASKKVKQDDTI